jgi:hypothetical protein
VKPVDPKVPDRPGGPQTSFDPTATKSKRSEGVGDACCYHWVQPCPGGRPLRDGDAIVRPRFVAVATGDTLPARGHHPEAAAAWLHDAGSEQASVASFARAAIELLAVGAPAELVLDCHRAAIDEIRHAALCTEIAWSLGAPHQAPRVIPAVAPREASILLVAVDSFVEGCVGETLAALVASKAALACTDAGIRSALESIADDEERHAALAWRTVAWALEAGGSAVAEALREAAAHRRPQREPPFVAPDRNDELAHLGRLGIAAQDEALRHGWRDVIDPLLQALLERAAADGVLNPQAAAAAC